MHLAHLTSGTVIAIVVAAALLPSGCCDRLLPRLLTPPRGEKHALRRFVSEGDVSVFPLVRRFDPLIVALGAVEPT